MGVGVGVGEDYCCSCQGFTLICSSARASRESTRLTWGRRPRRRLVPRLTTRSSRGAQARPGTVRVAKTCRYQKEVFTAAVAINSDEK